MSLEKKFIVVKPVEKLPFIPITESIEQTLLNAKTATEKDLVIYLAKVFHWNKWSNTSGFFKVSDIAESLKTSRRLIPIALLKLERDGFILTEEIKNQGINIWLNTEENQKSMVKSGQPLPKKPNQNMQKVINRPAKSDQPNDEKGSTECRKVINQNTESDQPHVDKWSTSEAETIENATTSATPNNSSNNSLNNLFNNSLKKKNSFVDSLNLDSIIWEPTQKENELINKKNIGEKVEEIKPEISLPKTPFLEPIENKMVQDLININFLQNTKRDLAPEIHEKRVIEFVMKCEDKIRLAQIIEVSKATDIPFENKAGFVMNKNKPDSGFQVLEEMPIEVNLRIREEENQLSELSKILNIKSSGSGQKSEIVDMLVLKALAVIQGPIKYADEKLKKLKDNPFFKPERVAEMAKGINIEAENLIEDFEILSKRIFDAYTSPELKSLLTTVFEDNKLNVKNQSDNPDRIKIKSFMLKGTDQAVGKILCTLHDHYNPNLDIENILSGRKPREAVSDKIINFSEKMTANVNLPVNSFSPIDDILSKFKEAK